MVKKDILFNGVLVGSYEATGDMEKDAQATRDFLSKKGLLKEITENDQMFGLANSFAEVANAIYSNHLKKSPYKGSSTVPFVVNATFSIELYLKTINNAYGNKIKVHNLVKLYANIPKAGKEIFITASNDVRPKYQLEIGANIHTCIESLSCAFEDWRYLYEKNRMSVELQSIRYTMNVAFEACSRVREIVKKDKQAE